jgi:hypothetical protein
VFSKRTRVPKKYDGATVAGKGHTRLLNATVTGRASGNMRL